MPSIGLSDRDRGAGFGGRRDPGQRWFAERGRQQFRQRLSLRRLVRPGPWFVFTVAAQIVLPPIPAGQTLHDWVLAALAQPVTWVRAAATSKVRGPSKQSVCRGCYAKIPLEQLAAEAKRIGSLPIEWLVPEEVKVVKLSWSHVPC